ncbi:MAG: DUF2065 domain-containing protein [Aestuariivita sp.]|nr:DUF2065 domain-containing protein [Aestuariivita sp.]
MSFLSVTLLAIGLVLILEGLVYVLAPSMIEKMLLMLRNLPENVRRQIGALAVVFGLIFVWLSFQFQL